MSSSSPHLLGTAARRPAARSLAIAGLIVLVSVLLVWPMLFTTSGFGGDWEHHLWYVWHQSLAIRADGLPSMFLNTRSSVLYPQYTFYGGTIYALAGTLALILGNSALSAYIVSYILGFMAAYGGWYWIGRILGLSRLLAQIPALAFVTSACYLTVVYASGDWPEFTAISMLPLMIAAGLSLLRAEQLRLLPAIAFAASSIVFFGSHALTVLWGSTLVALTGVALVVLVPGVRRRVRGRRMLRLLALVIPALLVNAWFLVPMIAYASHTPIGSQYGRAHEDLHETMPLVAFQRLFTLSRATTIPTDPDFALPLPTLTIVWVIASIALLLASVRRGMWVRILVILAVITLAIVVLMTHAGLLLALPKPYTLLQFSYRLEGYVLMGVSGAIAVVLLQVRSGATRLRFWAWTIVPIIGLSVIGAAQQLSAYPRTPLNRDATFTAHAEVFAEKYVDYSYVPLPFVPEAGLPELNISPSKVHDNRVTITVRVRRGQLAATNIGGGPNLLHIVGASVVGEDGRSQLVLAIGSGAGGASANPRTPFSIERISISPEQSTPVVLGRALTLAGAVILALELLGFSVLRYRASRGQRSSTPSDGISISSRERDVQGEPVDIGLL
jgi:hypothetical protein